MKNIQNYTGNDPLSVWVEYSLFYGHLWAVYRYINWAKQVYVKDTLKMKSIYEKCCETFAQSAQYKSDQRFLLIWLYYVFKLFVFMID